MRLTGRHVWEAIVKLGLMSGSYDPKTNRYCANADGIAGLLNEVLDKQESSWLPHVIQTEDAMRTWRDNTPREYVLRLYKFLNASGITVTGIDAAIEREAKGGSSNRYKGGTEKGRSRRRSTAVPACTVGKGHGVFATLRRRHRLPI